MVHHPLDDKEALSFYVDRMVHANNPDDHEALVTSIEQCGILARSVHKADVVLVDPTVTDLTTLVDVPGTLVSYRYVENCMFFGKRLPFGNYVVELPTSTSSLTHDAHGRRLKSEEFPSRALWRDAAPVVNDDHMPPDSSSYTARWASLQTPSRSIGRRHDVVVDMRSVAGSENRTLEASVLPSRLRTSDTGMSNDAESDVLKPPMPAFRVAQDNETRINLRSDPYFSWCVKYTRWATIVRPQTTLNEISDHVFRIIPGLFRTTLYNIAVYDKYEAEREALEKAQEEGREIAEERSVQGWSVPKMDAVIAKMARQVHSRSASAFEDGDGKDEVALQKNRVMTRRPTSTTRNRPPPPPPFYLLKRGKSNEAKQWMEDYFRWNLTQQPRLSILPLSYKISEKTGGRISRSTFKTYRDANMKLFKKIEEQVERETGMDVAHVTGRRNATNEDGNVPRRRSLEELIGSESENENEEFGGKLSRIKRVRRMQSPV
ncbi:hypothetical protein EXIGLDRAFT_836291 [Exidia glandulosa HHB12029]|uniref:Uncharacterized protein n=1 Tax=Exidia glandulosa HHB12029 TaxID=1314781 RepID=A0A165HZN6_EXIGL|nr:hypothetical protein EXIGLDRAFT_836291 [Exidia glandulosa HHB12029]